MKKKKKSTKAVGRRFKPVRYSIALKLPGVPLAPGTEIAIASETEHALFLQASEIYRVTDLLGRNLDEMIEAYSKFRTREPFRDALHLRFFGTDEGLLSKADPEIEAHVLGGLNRLHELKLRLAQIDALPFTVKETLLTEIAQLTTIWEGLCEALKRKLGWDLLALPR